MQILCYNTAVGVRYKDENNNNIYNISNNVDCDNNSYLCK